LVPAKNGSVTEAPDGRHITQCGATLDAAADEGAAADAPPLAAAVDLADMPDEVDVPPLVADVVVVADDVVVDVVAEEGVVAAIAGSPTAPDDPLVSAMPAMPEAVAAVCASPGPTSATSSGRTTRRVRNSWANGSVRSEPYDFYAARRVDHPPQARRTRSAPDTVIPANAGTQGPNVPSLALFKPGAGSRPALAAAPTGS
jgi:hypothetical protein